MTTLLAAPAMRQGRRSVARRQAIGPENVKPQTPFIPPSPIAATQSGETLHRVQPGVGLTGVHPAMVKAVAGLYTAMVAVFWLVFGHGEAMLALGFITVLGLMFFGLLTGMSLLADTPAPGERIRSLNDCLAGRVIIDTGWISGREAALQMLTLPACLLVTAVVLGAVYRFTAG